MPTFEFTSPEGKTYSVTGPEGSTKEQAFQLLQSQLGVQPAKQEQPSEPFGQRLNREIADIPRQVGLTARHGLNALGDAVGIFSDPIAALINIPTGSHLKTARTMSDRVADAIGLPSPANSTERIVGDVTELMGSAGGLSGAASKGANFVTGLAKKGLEAIAANPLQQVVSGGSAGAAGGYTRETGGNDAAQFLASLTAGVAAPMALSKAQNFGTAAADAIRNRLAPQQVNAQIDFTINNALKDSGVALSDLPANVQNSMRNDVAEALKVDKNLSPDAIRRLADYRMTGLTPTRATLTLDPALISQQKNLAKQGINSKDVAAQQLGQVENANNRQLIGGLNDLGAAQAPGDFQAGDSLIRNLQGFAASKKAGIDELYNAARGMDGRSAPLDRAHFAQTANDLLDEAMLGGKLPADVRNMMNWIASGKKPVGMHSSVEMPFDVSIAEQLKTRIGDLQRASNDKVERMALGLVRKALDETPLMMDGAIPPAAVNGGYQLKPLGGLSTEMRPNIGQETIDAFNRARGGNRTFMQQVERTPALEAAMEDAAPDAFFQKHVLRSDARDLRAMLDVVGDSPAAMGALKSEVLGYLKSQALGGAADEVGNFSQSAFNKAMRSIGDQKLNMLFSPQEIQQIKAIGRVASYEQVQPRGAAVNNSNTTAALTGFLDRVANSPLLSKIPLGSQLSTPLQNISVGLQAKQAMSVPRGLLGAQIPLGPQPAGLLMSPAAFMQPEDDRQRRGLLFP